MSGSVIMIVSTTCQWCIPLKKLPENDNNQLQMRWIEQSEIVCMQYTLNEQFTSTAITK